MKIWKFCGVAALGAVIVGSVGLTQLPGRTQGASAAVIGAGGLVEFKDYQTGLSEAKLKDKPLFVIFRCER